MSKGIPTDWAGGTLEDDGDTPLGERLDTVPCLLILSGADRGRQFPLRGESVTLGRLGEADIAIHDPRISRVHCMIEVTAEGIYLSDNESRNGTFVNGVRIQIRTPIAPDAQIRIGQTAMKVGRKALAEIEVEEEVFRNATLDPLTRVPNRRWFLEQAGPAISNAQRHGVPLSLVMLDIDHFKQINDTHGHAAGDRVLVKLGELLQDAKRQEDFLCRYGGEEFALLLQGTGLENAFSFAERLRILVASCTVRVDERDLQITVSLGVAAFSSGGDLESLMRRADEALYRAKEGGRNAVVAASANG